MLLSGLNRTREVPHQILDDSARVYPEKITIEEPGRGQISYGELASLSEQKSPRVLQHIAPKIENHLLLEAGGDKTVHNRQRVLDATITRPATTATTRTANFPIPKRCAAWASKGPQWMDCVLQRQTVAENDRTHVVSSAEHDGLRKALGHLRKHKVDLGDSGDEIGPEAPGSKNMGLWFHDLDGYRWELSVQDGGE